jgi:membrane protease YdiL (CAAX protease family)
MKSGSSQDRTLNPSCVVSASVTLDIPPRPAPLSSAVPIFAATSLLFFISLYVGLPYLRHKGVSWFWTYNWVLALPMFALVLFALLAYWSEGRPFTWLAMRDRFRLQQMDSCTWLWTGSLSVFMYGGRFAMFLSFGLAIIALTIEKRRDGKSIWIGAAALALFFFLCWSLWQTEPWLRMVPLHSEPLALREFLGQFGDHAFMGIPLHGRWWVAAYYALVLLFGNIAGEELWWRGYLLPRQELAHGRTTWIVHGVLWAAFHLFFQTNLWEMVRMVPTCCALAFVAQHRKNTWPGIVGHTLGNSPLLLQIVRGIAH